MSTPDITASPYGEHPGPGALYRNADKKDATSSTILECLEWREYLDRGWRGSKNMYDLQAPKHLQHIILNWWETAKDTVPFGWGGAKNNNA